MKAGGGIRWTMLIWGGAALLLSVPFFAMKFTSEVNWSASDFVVMGTLLAVACGIIELAARRGGRITHKLGVIAAVGGGFLIIWANLSVGHEHTPYDYPFYLALVVALRVAMAHEADAEGGNLLVTAVSSAAIASPFLLSAWLFRRAAR